MKTFSYQQFLLGMVLLIPAFIGYLYFQLYSVVVKQYEIEIDNLPPGFNGYTILHISDLHNKQYGSNQSKLLTLINRLNFDMVAITGDLVSKYNSNTDATMELIEGIKDKPIFFVPGNHEWSTGYLLKNQLAAAGVYFLENVATKIVRGKEYLWLIGVDDPYLGRDQLDKALEETDQLAPKILLAHSPDIFSGAVKNDINLVLVGHTHGGQVRLPFLGAIFVPGKKIFPKYDYGLYDSGFTKMVVNGGLGESILRIRFNNRPEIVLITLVST